MSLPPKHQLFESPNSRSIQIKDDWLITAITNPISNAAEYDALYAQLGFSLPEMTFGNNSLTLEYRPTGWKYSFTVLEALRAVKKGQLEEGDGGVKVEYADAWLKSRSGQQTVTAKPYDWTYTTVYPGHSDTSTSWTASERDNPAENIPMAELTRQDPILFYAEIPLFEDELHDNGSSALIVRIRVMPTCIFILSRFTLRVDNVLFRAHDTRIYHSFASRPARIVREIGGWEAPYEYVKKWLPKRDDLTPLTDPTWIAKILSEMPQHLSQQQGANTKWRGLGTRLEYTDIEQ